MKFPWSKPSAYEVVKALFDEFTPEERAILDGENCAIPHMYSHLLKASKSLSVKKYSLDEAKHEMELFFFSDGERVDVRDPKAQSDIFLFFNSVLQCCR